jgi:hypothetical protein
VSDLETVLVVVGACLMGAGVFLLMVCLPDIVRKLKS